ncbi:uncharacterized protein LOC129578650 isoform X3 [Sitodiplosis mosellana]|uniref:uncharacterized protein LOC129578650 isoform X3 n=1 Tax=Sitodiplosis mosellana TaxID=263140 RepID=UPI0024451AA5|nr:uncharacterized protein LOC129578650 isoform X3 [Sitodiplosis mosellana]
MKSFCAFVLISATVLFEAVIGQSQLPQYSTRYNNLNIEQILSSDRLVTNYVECLLSRKPCPPEGKDLKRILPEALRTKCARCSPQQLEGGLRVITKLYYDYPTQYNRLRAKWDPTGEYHRRFEEYLRGLQFNTINNDSSPQPTTATNNGPKTPSIVASASSNNQNVIPTALPTATDLFNNTQRPARNPEIAQNPSTNIRTTNSVAPSNGVFNRFGGDDDDAFGGDSAVVTQSTATTQRTMPTLAAVPSQRATQGTTKRPKRPNVVNEAPATVRLHKNTNKVVRKAHQPSEVEYTVYTFQAQPDVVYIQTQHPLVGLINSIGFKISSTADFFAGMLRGTIQKWFII